MRKADTQWWDTVFLERTKTMTDTTKLMTPGQMRQIIALATTTVPADFSYEEAARILRAGKPLRDKFGLVWGAARAPEETYNVKLPEGDVYDLIAAENFGCEWDCPRDCLSRFTYTGPRRRRVQLVVRRYKTDFVSQILYLLQRDGYRLADAREMFSYVKQHPYAPEACIFPHSFAEGEDRRYTDLLRACTSDELTGIQYLDSSGDVTSDWEVLAVKL